MLDFRRCFCGYLSHQIHDFFEILQTWSRDDDGVSSAPDIFSYS